MNVAFAISSRNYFSQTKATLQSFLQHNQNFQIQIFCIDKEIYDFKDFWNDSRIRVNFIKEIEIDNLDLLRKKYNDFEFCNALKPYLASWIFSKNRDVTTICYLDSDLYFYNKVSLILNQIQQNDIILTPHSTIPYPNDEFLTSELDILNSGLYNAGFFTVKRSDNTMDFLKWWQEKTLRYCKVDFEKGMFVDQIWLNFVPLYFKFVCILNNQGYNMAHWNLHERYLSLNNEWMVNEVSPLVFYHFSGFSFENVNLISKHQNRYNLDKRPDLIPIFQQYKEEIIKNDTQLNSIIGLKKKRTFADRIDKYLKKIRSIKIYI